MSRKTTLFYVVLVAIAGIAVGLVLASRLDLSVDSSAQSLNLPSVNTAPVTGPIDAQTFRGIAKAQSAMVVNIRTESRQRTQDLSEFFGGDDFLRRFFGMPDERRAPREQVTVAAGTGFIINKDGFILTNNHVVEGATKIEVSLFQEPDQEYSARIVGRDALTDSALIELTEKPSHALPVAKFGDSGQIEPGDWVMAIGNPFGLAHTVSVGVISAVKRPFPVSEGRWAQVLQTDAAINPGNSGGPLLNARGEVIGINAAIVSADARAGNVGIGFAIPINVVVNLLPQLRSGKVTRGRIGVTVTAVPADAVDEFGLKDRRGALVTTVVANGPAAKAGFEPGDVIVEYNGQPVPNQDELVRMVVETKPGTSVPVKIFRNKRDMTLHVTIEELDLEAETGREARGEAPGDTGAGFGMTLGNVSSEMARRLRLPPGVDGALITDVDPGGPAANAGLQPGDVILEVNRQAVESSAEAARALQAVASGGRALLLVWRRGQKMFLTLRKE